MNQGRSKRLIFRWTARKGLDRAGVYCACHGPTTNSRTALSRNSTRMKTLILGVRGNSGVNTW